MRHTTVILGKRCQVVLKNGAKFVAKVVNQNDRAFVFESKGWVSPHRVNKEEIKSVHHYKPQPKRW